MRRLFPLSAICAAILLVILQSVTLSAGTPAGTTISSTCAIAYLDDGNVSEIISDPISVTVDATAGVVLTVAPPPETVLPGRSYYLALDCTNTGNGDDNIALYAVSGHGWNVALIRDDNGDGIHQSTEKATVTNTGSLPPDSTHHCFLRVVVPPLASTGDTVNVTGMSVSGPDAKAQAAVEFPVPVPHTISFTQSPQVNPAVVDSGGVTQCTAGAVDSLGDEVTYTWSDGGAGGTFSPSASSQNPLYTASTNSSGADITVGLTCSARCSQGMGLTLAADPALTVHTTIPPQFDPDEVWAPVGFAFETPHVVLNNPNCPSSVTFTIGVPDGISLDTTAVNGSLACIRSGSGVDKLTADWDPDSRTMSVTATIPSPSQSVEIISSITMTAEDGIPNPQLTIDGRPALSIQLFKPAPGDFNLDRTVDEADVALFNQEWFKSHRTGSIPFDPAVDGVFDLGPRGIGVWPYWTPIGDGNIDIADATAFVECCTRSGSPAPMSNGPVQTFRTSTLIQVTVPSAPYGVYQVSITLPVGIGFEPAIDGKGNLRYVFRGVGTGSMMYSEFDAATGTLRIAGNVSGWPPYQIASVYVR